MIGFGEVVGRVWDRSWQDFSEKSTRTSNLNTCGALDARGKVLGRLLMDFVMVENACWMDFGLIGARGEAPRPSQKLYIKNLISLSKKISGSMRGHHFFLVYLM